MKYKIYLQPEFDDDFIADLKNKLRPEIELLANNTDSIPDDYDFLVSGVPDKELIENKENLKALIIPWAGLPVKTRDLMKQYPEINIYNLHHNAAPTAEIAVALMFAAARQLIPVDRKLRQNDWTPRYEEHGPILLNGKTALILGFGEIGRKIKRICFGLDMNIIPIANYGLKAVNLTVFPHYELHNKLPQADILFVTLPLTDKTKNLIGSKELSLLPDNAIVINIARGPIIEQEALYNELKSGRIRAGLDVWYNYPKTEEERAQTSPAEYDFAELDNVVMTPHMGGNSDQTEILRSVHLAELLNQLAQGESPPNRVDLDKGY